MRSNPSHGPAPTTGLVIVCLTSLTLTSPARAIVGGHTPAPDDTRFDAVGAFSRAKWLGLYPDETNANDHNWWCAATLIAPDLVLTAAHCISYPWEPGVLRRSGPGAFAVRFRRAVDGSLGSLEAGPHSYYHGTIDTMVVGEADVAVGRLTEPVPHIEPIPTLLEGTSELPPGTPIVHAGWGKEGPGFNEGPRRQLLIADNETAGRSAADTWIEFRNAWDPSGPGVGPNMHDSGSPILLRDPASEHLRVVGIATTVGSGPRLGGVDDRVDHTFVNTPFPDRDETPVTVMPELDQAPPLAPPPSELGPILGPDAGSGDVRAGPVYGNPPIARVGGETPATGGCSVSGGQRPIAPWMLSIILWAALHRHRRCPLRSRDSSMG